MEGLKGLEWSSQSLDLHLIEMGFFHNRKQTINAEKPSNMAEVKQICKKKRKKEWDKFLHSND